jgi:hypothetical protein
MTSSRQRKQLLLKEEAITTAHSVTNTPAMCVCVYVCVHVCLCVRVKKVLSSHAYVLYQRRLLGAFATDLPCCQRSLSRNVSTDILLRLLLVFTIPASSWCQNLIDPSSVYILCEVGYALCFRVTFLSIQ